MKIRYILCSILLIVFCSGCSVTYDLDIDKELNLNESININSNLEMDIKRIADFKDFYPINYEADNPLVFERRVDGVEYYDVTKNNDNNDITFNYKYNVDLYLNNVFARNCYEYVTAMDYFNKNEQRNELLISTSKKFLCFDTNESLEEVTVRIHTKRKVYDNNADEVKGKTYIWHINKNNKDDRAIIMKVSSSKSDRLSFWERNMIFIVFIVVFIVGLIIYLIGKKRSGRINKI